MSAVSVAQSLLDASALAMSRNALRSAAVASRYGSSSVPLPLSVSAASAAGIRLNTIVSTSSRASNRFFMCFPPKTKNSARRNRRTGVTKPAERNSFVQPCNFRFRQKCLQPSGVLTYPPSGGFTVTDSRGFAPTFPLPPEAAKTALYAVLSVVYHSTARL